eukprot:282752_1
MKNANDFDAKRFEIIYNSAQQYIHVTGNIRDSISDSDTKSAVYITTGCQTLNKLLNGGIKSSVITEIHGEPRTGKTLLCHQLSCLTQIPSQSNGVVGAVIYWDTEGTFRTDRMTKIAIQNNVEPHEILDNISYFRSNNPAEIQTIAKLFAETKYSLFIIDSINGLFEINENNRAREQRNLIVFVGQLLKICYFNNISIVITSQRIPNNCSYDCINFVLRNARWVQIHMTKDKHTNTKTNYTLSGFKHTQNESSLCISIVADWIDLSQNNLEIK